MACKHLLAALTELRSILLQALLNRAIIVQLSLAKAMRIASAGLLLLRLPMLPCAKAGEVSVSRIIRMRKSGA
jgi:hypothetical protein